MRHKVVVRPFDYGAFLDSKCLRRKLHIPHRHFHDRKRTRFGTYMSARKSHVRGRRLQFRDAPQIGAARDRRNEYR